MTEEKDYKLLPKIDSPADLRKLNVDQLPLLCDELRHDIIHELSVNPGHLASSLGVVELTVALHYVFDTPYDRIVWDVGHQAYGHKILTGRRDQFCTNRKLGGLKPFPFPTESEYDTFCCGHASNSVSAALGMAVAARLHGEKRKVVAVIGDGAMSGGLAFEGINNAAGIPNDLLVILNDNNMSIDNSVGGMREYLLKLNTNTTYNNLRYRASRKLFDWGVLNEKRRKSIIRFNNSLKSMLTRQQNMFEGMDIRYFGPTDGHDVVELVRVLKAIREMKGPKLLHVHTVKGKGYAPAEADPTTWHAPGKFDPETGERDKNSGTSGVRYQDVFGEVLCELARKDPKVVGITPAMATGSGLAGFAEEFPDRFFDVGIAEEHAATFSAGLAAGGMKPYCSIYSSFAQRAYDEIIHDVALQHLPVVFCFDRAGVVGEDGATHQGVFDLASMRSIPNTVIAAPKDEAELRDLLWMGLGISDGPYIIRYPRGTGESVPWRDSEPSKIEAGKAELLLEGSEVAVLALGPSAHRATEAARRLKEDTGYCPEVWNVRFLKPFDTAMLEHLKDFRAILTIEDGALKGGLFSEVSEYVSSHGMDAIVKGIGVPDRFIPHASAAEQRRSFGLDGEGIYSQLLRLYKNN